MLNFLCNAQVAQQQQQKINAYQAEREDAACASELELIDQGLQHSVASLEQALQQVRLEQRLLQHNRGVAADSAERNGNQVSDNSMWSENAQTHERGPASLPGTFKLGSSLFSIFGNGGLPLPITSQDGAGGLQADTPSTTVTMLSSTGAAVSTTPFDFPTCDFLRESLPAFQFAAAARDNGFVPEYSLYESPVNKMESIIDDSVCIVCLEQPAGVRLMVCSYCHFHFPLPACFCKMSKIDQYASKVKTIDLVCLSVCRYTAHCSISCNTWTRYKLCYALSGLHSGCQLRNLE